MSLWLFHESGVGSASVAGVDMTECYFGVHEQATNIVQLISYIANPANKQTNKK